MNEPNVIFLNDLPLNTFGRTTPELLAKAIGTEHLLERRHVTAYSGARPGNKPVYSQEAKYLSALFQKVKAVINNGGGSSGLMGDISGNCEYAQCFTTALFFAAFGVGNAEGINQKAINVVVPDFFTRKVALMAFSRLSCALPGGIGTIEEATEDLSFCKHRDRKIGFLNTNNYWDNLRAQFNFFLSAGLMPRDYARHYFFADTPEQLMEIGERYIVSPRTMASGVDSDPPKAKPTVSTQAYLRENIGAFIKTLKNHMVPFAPFENETSRIGLFASSNIGPDDGLFNVADKKLRKEICASAAKIGEDLAKLGALTVISGSNEGLRKVVADAVLRNGGQIVWVRKDKTPLPLAFRHKNNQELVISVPRHYEKDMVMSLLCEGYVGIAGGIHTMDQVIGHMTRSQTGHGVFSEVLPHYYDPKAPKPIITLLDPGLSNGQTLWTPLLKQIHHGIQEGFISASDTELLQTAPTPEGLVAQAIEASWKHPNGLMKGAKSNEPLTPEARKLCEIVGVGAPPAHCGL